MVPARHCSKTWQYSAPTAIESSTFGTRHSQSKKSQQCCVRKVTPNPSLKRSANGRPPGPVWRYAVHFRQPGPGVLPSSPA